MFSWLMAPALLLTVAAAQSPPDDELRTALRARALLDSALSAHGGEARLRGIRDLSIRFRGTRRMAYQSFSLRPWVTQRTEPTSYSILITIVFTGTAFQGTLSTLRLRAPRSSRRNAGMRGIPHERIRATPYGSPPASPLRIIHGAVSSRLCSCSSRETGRKRFAIWARGASAGRRCRVSATGNRTEPCTRCGSMRPCDWYGSSGCAMIRSRATSS